MNPGTTLFRNLADAVTGRDSGMGARLARGAMSTAAYKVWLSGLSFLVGLFLARWLGSAGYGAYAYAAAWVALLSGPSTAGLENLVMRDVAALQVRSAWGEMRGLLRQTRRVTLLVSMGLAVGAAGVVWLFAGRADRLVMSTLWIALALLPLLSFIRLGQGALQGLHFVTQAQFPAFVIQPAALTVLLWSAHFLIPHYLTASMAMGLNVAAVGLAAAVLAFLVRRHLPEAVRQASPVHRNLAWTSSVLPLMLFACINTIYTQTDTLVLGAMKGAGVVGIYSAANRSAGLISFFMMAMNPGLAPVVASLYAARDLKRLQRVVVRSARLTLAAAVPAALVFLLFGEWFLSRFFEHDFGQGRYALAILTAGQLVNVAMGSVAYLLVMTGFEAEAAKASGAGVLVNLALNLVLIPKWGLEGAAVAAATSMVFLNVWLTVVVRRKIGIHCTAWGGG